MFKKKEKKNIYVRLVNTQGEIIREFDCTEKDLRKVKENGAEIRLVGDNSYEMVATDEQLEKLARAEAEIEAEIKAWEDALNESLDEREEREARQKELKEKNKWSTKKKVIVFGLIFFVFIGLPIIEGYQNSKLVEEGTSLNAEIVGRHVEKEFMFTHPTLVVEVDGKKHNVWVSEETYNGAEWLGRLKVIKTKDGKVEKDPRYEGEDLITSY
ncbi:MULTISPECIES: hypothetical protein [Bacillus]|uniref:hypothetical protein n=1 Tax=Bacillus TaxID=1386 RepID=UPI00027BF24C|nr:MULTISPECIES: hypothetical protein [Bacillus cereus group]MBJ8072450.1 hypothetical protein [Bacillus cereus]EJV71211.1 hypothetical protein IEM_00771 [Bacillus cereus BAG6O-2]MBJ8189267.1 hypothetical protein [Bacillus cereus]OFD44198.1 hypothetical protein BWGOE3_32130 [Bacillus mycoides]OFD58465.1 hypothetical protein BWGOE6_31890 [Bacillus mycoides]